MRLFYDCKIPNTCWCCFMASVYKLFYLPVQLNPFPVYPDRQVHVKLSVVLVQLAAAWQPPLFLAHWLISESSQINWHARIIYDAEWRNCCLSIVRVTQCLYVQSHVLEFIELGNWPSNGLDISVGSYATEVLSPKIWDIDYLILKRIL